jgi:hypothetical protein
MSDGLVSPSDWDDLEGVAVDNVIFSREPTESSWLLEKRAPVPGSSPASPSWIDVVNPAKSTPKTSVKASIFALVSSMVGGGTLSVPFAVQSAG